jgi:hypothetical protein
MLWQWVGRKALCWLLYRRGLLLCLLLLLLSFLLLLLLLPWVCQLLNGAHWLLPNLHCSCRLAEYRHHEQVHFVPRLKQHTGNCLYMCLQVGWQRLAQGIHIHRRHAAAAQGELDSG